MLHVDFSSRDLFRVSINVGYSKRIFNGSTWWKSVLKTPFSLIGRSTDLFVCMNSGFAQWFEPNGVFWIEKRLAEMLQCERLGTIIALQGLRRAACIHQWSSTTKRAFRCEKIRGRLTNTLLQSYAQVSFKLSSSLKTCPNERKNLDVKTSMTNHANQSEF